MSIKISLNKRLVFLSPYFLVAFFFILLPTIFLFVKSFTPVSSNFDNFALLKESTTWKIMWRSIATGIATSFICLIIGLPFAYWTAREKSKLRRYTIMIFLISPLMIFTLAKVLGIRAIFVFLFGESPALSSGYFATFGLVYLNLPFMIIPLYSVFESMPKSLVEASEDLGYNKIKTLFYVVLPYGYKATISGIALVFMLSSTSIAVSQKMLINALEYQLIANQIVNYAHIQNNFDLALCSSLALVTTFIVMGVYFLIIAIFRYKAIFEFFSSKFKKIKKLKERTLLQSSNLKNSIISNYKNKENWKENEKSNINFKK